MDLATMRTSFEFGQDVNTGLVKELFAEWGKGNFVASAKKILAKEVVWKTPWAPDCVGKAAVLKRMEQLASYMSAVEVDWLTFVSTVDPASRDKLLVAGERRDVYKLTDGTEYVVECCCAVKVGRAEIVYIRDYFDPRPLLTEDAVWPPLL